MAESEAVCTALRDILKRLVGPAAPAVVLSTRPANRLETQVSGEPAPGAGLCGPPAASLLEGRLQGRWLRVSQPRWSGVREA